MYVGEVLIGLYGQVRGVTIGSRGVMVDRQSLSFTRRYGTLNSIVVLGYVVGCLVFWICLDCCEIHWCDSG